MKKTLTLVLLGLSTYCLAQNHYPTEAQNINKLVAKIDSEKLTTSSYLYSDDYEEVWMLYVMRDKQKHIKKVEFSLNYEESHNTIYYLEQNQVVFISDVKTVQERWINQWENNYYLKDGNPFYSAVRHNYKAEYISDTGAILTEFTEEHAIQLYTKAGDFENLITRSKRNE